jgi:DNA-binding CsgD family transcriptional regulator
VSFSLGKRAISYFKRKKHRKIKPDKGLNEIEKKILEEISIGKSYNTIADELSLSKDDIQKLIRNIYIKLQTKNDD